MSALPQTRPRAATGLSLAARAKRWLYLLHRWAGITLCLFFAMWFISGVVMMYVGYPKLTPAERLGHLAPLDPAGVTVTPAQALAAAGLEDGAALSLSASRAGQAVYLAGGGRRAPAVDAASGVVARGGRAGGRRHGLGLVRRGLPVRYAGAVDEDVYTHSRALDPHRPLHRVDAADPDHTRLYISSATGAVVLDATRAERAWNYVGAWIHWLYPFRGNALDRWWHDIVVWLSVAGVTLALTGTVVGLMRWRFAPLCQRQPLAVPREHDALASSERPAVRRRHHHLDLQRADVDEPLETLRQRRRPLAQAAYEGPPAPAATLAAPAALIAALPAAPRELSWTRAAGQSLVQARMAAARRCCCRRGKRAPPRSTSPCCAPRRHAAAGRPAGRGADAGALRLLLLRARRARHAGPCGKPLPAWRLVYDNPEASWVYLDPATGQPHQPAGSRQPRQPLAVRLPAQLGLDRPAGAPPTVGRAADLPEPGRGRAQPDRRGDRLAPAGEEVAALNPAAGRARPGNAARDALCSQPRLC